MRPPLRPMLSTPSTTFPSPLYPCTPPPAVCRAFILSHFQTVDMTSLQAGGQQGAVAGSEGGGGGGGSGGDGVQRGHRAGFRQLLRNTLADQGIIGLYRGVGPTLLGILPYAGLKWVVLSGRQLGGWAVGPTLLGILPYAGLERVALEGGGWADERGWWQAGGCLLGESWEAIGHSAGAPGQKLP
eukprot:365023-Chlamydomonas_euryale.AAC.13